MSGNKRARPDELLAAQQAASAPAQPSTNAKAAHGAPSSSSVPTTLEEAAAESVDVSEVMEKIVQIPPHALWLVMFENGTWIKNALEKINRILPDVGVFNIDYVQFDVEDGNGGTVEVTYFFLLLCQELKERNGTVLLQYPLHTAIISEKYVDKMQASLPEGEPTPAPVFAGVISQLLNSLRNSTDRSALDPAASGESVSNQAKLVHLTLEEHADMPAEMIVVRSMSCNPFKDGQSKTKRTQTSMFASVSLQLLYEEYNKSHAAVDRSSMQASKHYMSSIEFDQFDFGYSVHNLSAADMNYTLTKTVSSKQAPREYMQSQTGHSFVDGDVLARFRLFTMMDESQSPPKETLIFNIQVMNQSTHQLFDVRYPTQVHTPSADEIERETRQETGSVVSQRMREALLRRVRFTKVEAPLMDEEALGQYKPKDTEVKFDEYYSARTLAPMFSSTGGESFTLYFGYPKAPTGRAHRPQDNVSGVMLIDVNRVAVDDRVAQLLIMVNPHDTRVHTSLRRTEAAANPNPFAK